VVRVNLFCGDFKIVIEVKLKMKVDAIHGQGDQGDQHDQPNPAGDRTAEYCTPEVMYHLDTPPGGGRFLTTHPPGGWSIFDHLSTQDRWRLTEKYWRNCIGVVKNL
jgi:hypothetical protein